MNAFTPRPTRNGKQLRAERTRVSVEASIVTIGAYHYPELADISLRGAKLRGITLPPPGTKALLRAGELEVLCQVKWMKEGHCGICFEEAVHPSILKQVQLDGSVALDAVDPAVPQSGDDHGIGFSAK